MIPRILLTAWAAIALSSFAQSLPQPDIVVAADGSGSFKTVQAAIASIAATNRERIVVFIKGGVYREKVRVDAAFVTLRGENRHGTRIEFSQLAEDFTKLPDKLGRAVINVNGDDFILENLTAENTAGQIGPHAFTIYGKGDRTVIVNCDVLSHGADTVSLWLSERGRYYHANSYFRGSVDFVCPRGWCYVTNCTFYEMKPGSAAMWHDGSKERDMKFVLRDCTFDGTNGWVLARHHLDAQFYFLDCTFAQSMADRPIKRVIYPLNGGTPSEADIEKNAENDRRNLWGERNYFWNCRREGGDFAWYSNNLATATGSPTPDQITPAWTFANTWDPERVDPPVIKEVRLNAGQFEFMFSEAVTVKGKLRLKLKHGELIELASGGGSKTLSFKVPVEAEVEPDSLVLTDGAIVACEAGATLRVADLTLPAPE
jgi:pectinesterase